MTEVSNTPGKGTQWAGYIFTGLPALFFVLDAVGKLIKPEAVVKGTLELGYQESVIVPLGVLLLICTIIYIIPQTAVLGAILLTGYLGGTVATHVRIGNPLFTHTLFGVYLGIMLWIGLYLRDARLRALVPLVRRRS
ncbi:MAG: DoxX family protein [Pyrinomonadaceae bacterium]